MEVGGLYQFVLLLVLVGIVLGVGILILDKLGASVDSTAAETALNDTRDALGTIGTDWMGIIVIVGVCAVILFLVIRAFTMKGR